MWLSARGRPFCVPVSAVLNCLRVLSDPRVHPDIIRHWFGTIKNFPRVDQLLRVLAPGSLVCVARGGNLTAELAYGNHLSVVPHAVAVHQTICADDVHGRDLVCKLSSASDIRGLRVSPLSVVLKPMFRIIHDLTFARAGGHSSVNDDTDFPLPPPASSVMCFGMCCFGCSLCGRSTVP